MAPPNMGIGFPRPTKKFHGSSYPSIDPSRPELSVKGQTVLITGGATGIGLETSNAFAAAGASTIALLARSQARMTAAKDAIETAYAGTKVLTYATSITDSDRVNQITKEIGTIDILILNAGIMHKPGPALDINPEEALENFKVNVLGPWNLIKAFMALPARSNDTPRTIIYTSSAGVHFIVPGTSVYNASKSAMTYIMCCIHEEYGDSGVRTFTIHPAFAFTDMARDVLGLKEDQFSYDSLDLPAHFAVWLCSSEADFLKGRFLWAHWDVDELKAKKDTILSDPNQLKIGLVQEKLVE